MRAFGCTALAWTVSAALGCNDLLGNELREVDVPDDSGADADGAYVSTDSQARDATEKETADAGPASKAGRWTGLTSQGRLFEMNIFADAFTRLRFDWKVEGMTPIPGLGCQADVSTDQTFTKPLELPPSGQFDEGPFGNTLTTFSITGVFSSGIDASGTIRASYANTKSQQECYGSSMLSWQATQVVCGDGIIEWPETCDEPRPLRPIGADAPNDGCSTLCQLLPIHEIEPNDTKEAAEEAYMTDVVLAGSLTPATDVDVYAISNPYPGHISVFVETFGQAPGVCGIDTVVDVIGKVTMSDDDGSRAFHCSATSFGLDSAETAYLRVYTPRATEIPTYHLHVRFQKR